jgi:hypothetical protein
MKQLGAPLDEISWHLIFEDFFSKICRENSRFLKVRQEQRVLHMKTNTYILDYISPSSSYTEKCFSQKLKRKSKHFMLTNFFVENLAVYEIM